MNRKNREAGIDFDSLVSRGVNAVKERLSGNASGQRGQDRVVRDAAIRKSDQQFMGMKKGGSVKVSSASSRADGIAQRGKTRGTLAKHGK